jgi:hypothetical protein
MRANTANITGAFLAPENPKGRTRAIPLLRDLNFKIRFLEDLTDNFESDS